MRIVRIITGLSFIAVGPLLIATELAIPGLQPPHVIFGGITLWIGILMLVGP